MEQTTLNFDGPAYDPAIDAARLVGLLQRVFLFMADEQWHTTMGVAHACGGTETGAAAMIRKLRRTECGGHTIHRRRHPDRGRNGLFQYRLEINRGQ